MQSEEIQIESIFKQIHEALDVKIEYKEDPNTHKIKAHFDVDACMGKFHALMVYVGWVVPVNSMPNYNSVHANIEYWKQKFQNNKIEETVAPSTSESTTPTA